MIKWIGQHIWDFVSRFRNDIYIVNKETSYEHKVTTSTNDVDVVVPSALSSLGGVRFLNEFQEDPVFNFNVGRAFLDIKDDLASGNPGVRLQTGSNTAYGTNLTFTKARLSGGSIVAGVDNDVINNIYYKSYNDASTPEAITFAQVLATIKDASDTDEAGGYEIKVATSDGSTSALQNAFSASGQTSHNYISTTIGYGTASVATIAGTLTMGTTAAMTNAGQLSVAAQPNITTMTGFLGGTANALVTDDGDGTVTSEAGLTYDSEVLTIGDDDSGTATIKRKTHSDESGGMLQISGGDATGTDKGGGITFITGGLGTGTGGGGRVRISTAAADSSGSSANSLDWSWDFNNDGVFQTTSNGYGITEFINFHTTTFENVLSDGDHVAGKRFLYSPGANDTLTDGQIFFLHTDGTWDQADASATSTGASQLLCVGNGAARTAGVILDGFVRIPSTEILNTPGSGAVDGLPLYVSTTAGHFDFTAPSGNNEYVRVVGYAIDDDSSDVLVYFNPDSTHVKITA